MAKKKEVSVIQRPRFAGIGLASEKLGVGRHHLRKVLLGERKSDRLMAKVRKAFPGFIVERS